MTIYKRKPEFIEVYKQFPKDQECAVPDWAVDSVTICYDNSAQAVVDCAARKCRVDLPCFIKKVPGGAEPISEEELKNYSAFDIRGYEE